jgi:hypothetical protein
MAMEATFRELSVGLNKLHDALNEILVTLGDKPADEESALADGLETTVLDTIGTLHEARKAVVNVRRGLQNPPDLDGARKGLTLCQEHFNHLEKDFKLGLASYEKLKELARLGNERSWLPWADTVKREIEQCLEPLEQTSKALAACREELARL